MGCSQDEYDEPRGPQGYGEGSRPQIHEAEWWGDCTNTYGEETKQLVYASYMGLKAYDAGLPGPVIDLEGKSVLDVGGGPCSLLLKTINRGRCVVVDPCPYPAWVRHRYTRASIALLRVRGETVAVAGDFDEVWMYNVLQHVEDPSLVIKNALAAAPYVRMLDWLDTACDEMHPHSLTREYLDSEVGVEGVVVPLDKGGAVGTAWVYTGPTAR